MRMDAKGITALAGRIADARRSRKVMDFLAAETADLSEADSYKVQFAVHDALTGNGQDRIAGWKVALTLPHQYEPMKLSGPVFAGIYQSGVRPSGTVFEKGWPLKAGVECEMVARMARDVTAGNTPYTADSIKAYVGSLHCGMEVVENRYSDVTKVSGPGRIADDVLQAACIVGTEIKDWQKLDFAKVQGRSEYEGKELGAGPGTNVMGGAMISLAWLANKLIEHGKHLQAGDVILTGSVHVPQFLPGPGTAKSEFIGLGEASITVR
jgi:2-oxo-3-hexenedioate decarboxylase/2-keto-4-pentenoate hydratase